MWTGVSVCSYKVVGDFWCCRVVWGERAELSLECRLCSTSLLGADFVLLLFFQGLGFLSRCICVTCRRFGVKSLTDDVLARLLAGMRCHALPVCSASMLCLCALPVCFASALPECFANVLCQYAVLARFTGMFCQHALLPCFAMVMMLNTWCVVVSACFASTSMLL